MTGIQRQQFGMLTRVRNFGNTNHALFASSPVARETFAAVGAAVDDLAAADMKKMSASASARADRKAAARRDLVGLLQKVHQLAGNLRAEGRSLPPFDLPASKSDLALLTAGRQFAVDAAPFEAEFGGHGMGQALMTATVAAFETAMNDQGMSRTEHVTVKRRIHDLLATAIRGVRRLDLIIANDLRHDHAAQAAWAQLRRVTDPRVARGSVDPEAPAPVADADTPATEAA